MSPQCLDLSALPLYTQKTPEQNALSKEELICEKTTTEQRLSKKR